MLRPGLGDGLRRANCRKNGAPFQYADAMIMQATAIRIACRMAYRQLEGIICGMPGGAVPCCTTICRRIQNLDVDMCGRYVTVRDGAGGTVLIADATGLKQHNRGEWIRHKWKSRRGFVKMHILVDADTKKIVSLAVTDESAGDGPQLKKMLEEAQKHYGRLGKARGDAARGDAVRTGTARRNMLATGIPPLARPCGGTARPAPDTTLLADAVYGSRANVAECDRPDIDPLMRLKINSTAKGRGSGDAWGVAARRQLGGGPEEKIVGLTREERLENRRYRKSTV